MGHGLEFEASYVWSKSIDRGEGYSAEPLPHGRGALGFLTRYPASLRRQLSLRIALRQGTLLPAASCLAWSSRLVGGWQFNGITTIQSGTALSITGSNTAGTFGAIEYANNNGTSGALSGRAQDRLNRWFNTSVFSQPDTLHLRQRFAQGRRYPRALHQQLRPLTVQGISSRGRMDEDAVPCRSAECIQPCAVR